MTSAMMTKVAIIRISSTGASFTLLGVSNVHSSIVDQATCGRKLAIKVDYGPLPTGWGSFYRITNRWIGAANGEPVNVLAGSKVDDRLRVVWNDPQQGILIVETYPPRDDGVPWDDEY